MTPSTPTLGAMPYANSPPAPLKAGSQNVRISQVVAGNIIFNDLRHIPRLDRKLLAPGELTISTRNRRFAQNNAQNLVSRYGGL